MTESGLIVFKVLEGQLSHTNVYLEVLVDDHMFPSYTSMKIKSRNARLEDGMFLDDRTLSFFLSLFFFSGIQSNLIFLFKSATHLFVN